MAEKVKVTVRPGRSIAVGGRFVSGEAEVPADKVEVLARKGLIERPAQEKAESGGARAADELPEEFPHRDLLTGTPFKTLGAVKAASDEELLAVEGIGPAKLKQIREAVR